MTDLNMIAQNYIAAWNENGFHQERQLPRSDHAGRRP